MASTALVPLLECWEFRPRRSATGRSATRRSSRSGARADTGCTPAIRWSSSASSQRRSRAGSRRPTPIASSRTRAGWPAPASDGGSNRTQLLVLLAERDPVAAELVQFFLRTEGYEVKLALAVEEAEEQWLESRPQLAIVELMISGGTGAELCRRLKQREAGAVIAISSLEARDEALASGADAFLQKPFEPLELVSTVKDLVGTSALVGRRHAEEPLVDERLTSGDRGARRDPRRRPADERNQPDHRAARLRKDHAVRAVRLRWRDRRTPCASTSPRSRSRSRRSSATARRLASSIAMRSAGRSTSRTLGAQWAARRGSAR